MSKRAIILAGGKGTRLKPYTIAIPKPLVPIGDTPILEIIIKQLAKSGFDHITITINHMADIIKAFFDDGSKWGVKIDYSLEDKPLSTMGPLTLIEDLPDNFLIMNGDVLTDLNFDNFFNYHIKSHNIFTISSYKRHQKIDYGVLETNEKSILTGFQEKPISNYTVSMGVYMANKNILNFIPKGECFGFDDLMFVLLNEGQKVNVKPFNGYWLDIGRPEDYVIACKDSEKIL
jgi:NDP-mannose synthase